MAKVYVSAVLDAAVERAWGLAGDFNGLPNWLPGIKSSEIEGGKAADEIGAVRAMDVGLPDMKVREKLLDLSEDPYGMTYSVLDGPLPLDDLVSTMNFRPVTDTGQTFVEWFAEFEPHEGAEEKAQKIVTKVFKGGLVALAEKLMETD